MTDTPNGIDAMRSRMARASRKPPRARNPRPHERSAADPETTDTRSAAVASPLPGPPPGRLDAPEARTETPAPKPGTHLAPDLPPVNLAIRVRRPLDDRLVEIIHILRGRGVRTSKVELIEMLMWELADDDAAIDEIVGRLARFRGFAPRSLSSAIPQ